MVRWSAVVSLHALLLAETCAVRPAMDVEWPSFLARSDMTSRWSRPSADAAWVEPGPPFSYDKAGFMGNGNLGAMVQATENGSVVLVLGRTDAYDRRVPGSQHAVGQILCDVAKLPIGNLTLQTVGAVLSVSSRVRLWDGEVTVQLNTTAGAVYASLFVYGGNDAPSGGSSGTVVASFNATGGEQGASWSFTPGNPNANAPHPVYKTESYACRDSRYANNPAPVLGSTPTNITTTRQDLLVGVSWATALGVAPGVAVLSTSTALISASVQAATADCEWSLETWSSGQLLARHRAEWHQFYTDASFLSIAHPRLEQFYWLQQYKLGSGMGLRGDLDHYGGAMDHTSPWYLPNNGLFNWDLNIEMTWWSVVGANRVQLIEPLLSFLEMHVDDFCLNVAPAARDPSCHAAATAAAAGEQQRFGPTQYKTLAGPTAHTGYVAVGRIQVGHGDPDSTNHTALPPGPLGDLVWTLSNVEQAWRFTRNITLAHRLYPLLSGAVNYYLHWLTNESTGASTARLMPDTNFHSDNILGGGCAPGGFKHVNYTTYEHCQLACDQLDECDMWVFVGKGERPGAPWCCLKTCHGDPNPACPVPQPDKGCTGGVKKPQSPARLPQNSTVFHLPPTYSPEYLGGLGTGDTHYELALCRWGLRAVIALNKELGLADPQEAVWKKHLDHLAGFATDPEFGLNVARDLPFEQPHRHFSHLMGAVLHDPTLSTADGVSLVAKSVAHWRSLRDPCSWPLPRPTTRDQGPVRDEGWTGFSYAVSALLHARLQQPKEALADATHMVENSVVDGKAGGAHLPPAICVCVSVCACACVRACVPVSLCC